MPHLYKIHAMAEGSISSSTHQRKSSPISLAVRWGMPSVSDLIFIATLCTLLFTALSERLLNDAGIGWHIRTGQLILQTHAVPKVDPFSSTMAGRPWFAWEWLYDAIVGYLDSAWRLGGPVWLTAILIAATFSQLFRFLIARGTSLVIALIFVLLALSGSTIHFLARPHVVSWLLCLVWIWILDSREREALHATGSTRRRLWVLPLLMLLWANLHAGFLLGFVLLTIFWLSTGWTWLRMKDVRIEESLEKISAGKLFKELTVVGFLSLLASFVNPYGWKLHAHIYSYLSNRFLMDHIEEFQSPNFHRSAQKCFLALLLLAVLIVIARGRALRASGILTILFAIYAGLDSSRNIPVSSILLVMVIAPLVPRWSSEGFFSRMDHVEHALRGHVWPFVAAVFTLFAVANGGRVGEMQAIHAQFSPHRMPVSAVDFISSAHIKGPILTPDYWGGYVIYRMYPNQRVVLDDRHDLYGADFLKNYLNMIHVEDGWESFLKETNPGCLVLPTQSALANILNHTTGWRSIYSEPSATVFVRDRTPTIPEYQQIGPLGN